MKQSTTSRRMKFLSLLFFFFLSLGSGFAADEAPRVRGLRGTRNAQSTAARKMSKGSKGSKGKKMSGFFLQEQRQDNNPPFNTIVVNPPQNVAPLPPQEYVPSTDRRDISVAVQYYGNPQDVGWIIEKIDRDPIIPWLTSDVGDLTAAHTNSIVTQFKEGMFIGRYKLTIINKNGQGISSGQGWLKVFDVTNMNNVNVLDGAALVTAGAKVVLSQGGRTGALFFREFDLK